MGFSWLAYLPETLNFVLGQLVWSSLWQKKLGLLCSNDSSFVKSFNKICPVCFYKVKQLSFDKGSLKKNCRTWTFSTAGRLVTTCEQNVYYSWFPDINMNVSCVCLSDVKINLFYFWLPGINMNLSYIWFQDLNTRPSQKNKKSEIEIHQHVFVFH